MLARRARRFSLMRKMHLRSFAHGAFGLWHPRVQDVVCDFNELQHLRVTVMCEFGGLARNKQLGLLLLS
jgi:hypothetical protein